MFDIQSVKNYHLLDNLPKDHPIFLTLEALSLNGEQHEIQKIVITPNDNFHYPDDAVPYPELSVIIDRTNTLPLYFPISNEWHLTEGVNDTNEKIIQACDSAWKYHFDRIDYLFCLRTNCGGNFICNRWNIYVYVLLKLLTYSRINVELFRSHKGHFFHTADFSLIGNHDDLCRAITKSKDFKIFEFVIHEPILSQLVPIDSLLDFCKDDVESTALILEWLHRLNSDNEYDMFL